MPLWDATSRVRRVLRHRVPMSAGRPFTDPTDRMRLLTLLVAGWQRLCCRERTRAKTVTRPSRHHFSKPNEYLTPCMKHPVP